MRSWKSAAVAGVWLAAAACGGNEETSRADLESETMGGEQTRDRYSSMEDEYERATTMPRDDVAMGTTELAPGDSDIIQSDDARGEYTGMAGATDRDLTGTGVGSTEPLDADRLAQAAPMPAEGEMGSEPPAAICPADIEGLNVRVSTIPRGGALIFTASAEQVEELRARLNRFKEMHQEHHAQMQPGATSAAGSELAASGETSGQPGSSGAGTGDTSAWGSTGGMQPGSEQPSTGQPATQPGAMASVDQQGFADETALIHQATDVRVLEIPRGARLEIRFDDRTRVRDLRAELRENATMLREGRCPLALQLEST